MNQWYEAQGMAWIFPQPRKNQRDLRQAAGNRTKGFTSGDVLGEASAKPEVNAKTD
jgi:hypothetical protein